MQSEKGASEIKSTKKGYVKKVLLWLFVFVIVIIFAGLIAVPIYLSSQSGKDMILGRINDSIDGRVDAESFSMGWFKGVQVDRFNFNDNSGNTNVTAKKITAKPKYFSLLAGNVVVDKATIDEPRISIKLPAKKEWITETQDSEGESVDQQTTMPAIPVVNVNLVINDGNLKLETAGIERVGKLEFRDINSKLAIRPLGQKSNFNISMSVADENDVSQISADGEFKTSKKWAIENTSGNLRVEVNELDISKLAPLFTLLDVDVETGGIISADIDAKMDKGLFENVDCNIKAEMLDINGTALKGDRIQSEKLTAIAKFSTDEKFINIETLDIQADWLKANFKGTMPKSLRSLDDFLKAETTDELVGRFDCDVAMTLGQVKNMAGFKKDFDITHGRLSGDVETTAVNGKRIISSKVKLWTLEGKFPVKQIVLSRPVDIEAKVISENKDVTIEKLLMDSSFARVLCKGKIDAMEYDADIDFEKWQYDMGQFFDYKHQLSGQAKIKGFGSWKNKVLSSNGKAVLGNIVIKTADGKVLTEPAANVQYRFGADTKKQILSVDSLGIQSSVGNATISNFVVPMKSRAGKDMKIHALVSADLELAMPWAVALGGIDDKIQLAGKAKSDLMINKSGDILKVATKQTTINNLRISYPEQEPFAQNQVFVAFDGVFDTANKIYDIKTLNVVSEQIKIAGSITNSQVGNSVKTQGKLKAKYDLAAVSTMIAPYLPQGLSVTGKRDDYFNFATVYPKNEPAKKMANLNAKTSFGFDRARYMGIAIGKTELDINISNGVMTIAPFSATANNGRITFGATADFARAGKIMRTPGAMNMLEKIEINSETSDALLSYVNPLFADAVNVTGILNFACEKLAIPLESGYKKDIAVTGVLSIDNARLGASSLLGQIIQLTGVSRDPVITVMPTRFVLANEKLSYDNMEMDIDGKKINFRGSIWLDKRMQMDVTLPWKINGQRLTLPLKGTVNNPKIDTDKLIEMQLQQQGQKLIEEGLRQIFK